MSDEEHHFESKADAGASKTYPQQAGTIRKNGYIVIKGRPCKGEEGIDVRNMTEHKRSPCSVDQSSFTSLASKRHKTDLSISTKERKEKLGERIVALQQLVSPYGKTDTASVLLEAMDYIRFLHEQVKVLSAPYLESTPTAKMQELEPYSLRSRGLCLVPVSCTAGVAQSNGADIWAPIKNTSPKFENAISQFH